jgi:hypothetical protein
MSYRIEIGSPVNYEKLVAYVIVDEKYLCILSQDNSIEQLEVHFINEEEVKIEYSKLIEALDVAKRSLIPL